VVFSERRSEERLTIFGSNWKKAEKKTESSAGFLVLQKLPAIFPFFWLVLASLTANNLIIGV
jgi:hypothetical protein